MVSLECTTWELTNLLQFSTSVYCVRCNISTTSARVLSGVPNTEKQMKARGRRPSAFIVSRCLERLMKPEARVFEMASQTSVKISWNFFQRIGHHKVCSTGNCSFFIHMVNELIFTIHFVHEVMCIGEY